MSKDEIILTFEDVLIQRNSIYGPDNRLGLKPFYGKVQHKNLPPKKKKSVNQQKMENVRVKISPPPRY